MVPQTVESCIHNYTLKAGGRSYCQAKADAVRDSRKTPRAFAIVYHNPQGLGRGWFSCMPMEEAFKRDQEVVAEAFFGRVELWKVGGQAG
jgi:hypothetical protein